MSDTLEREMKMRRSNKLAKKALEKALTIASGSKHVSVAVKGEGFDGGSPWAVRVHWRRVKGDYSCNVTRVFSHHLDGTYNVEGIAKAITLGMEEGGELARVEDAAKEGYSAAGKMITAACSHVGLAEKQLWMETACDAVANSNGTVTVSALVQPESLPEWKIEKTYAKRTCETVDELIETLEQAVRMTERLL